MDDVGTVVVGGGPAALALLLASRRSATLDTLLRRGLRVIEKGSCFGAGDIGTYAIRSDSHADSFINALSHGAPALTSSAACRLDAARGSPAALQDIGDFLADLGSSVRRELAIENYDPVIGGTLALYAERDTSGRWTTHCRTENGGTSVKIRSASVVLANGAVQPRALIETAVIAGVALYPTYASHTVPSAEFLTSECQSKLRNTSSQFRNITVIGGSHSAMACARMILTSPKACFQTAEVRLLHRSSPRITYPSPSSARADGYADFSDRDICPKTGRVFPLAGFRCDSRDLLRAQWSLGGLSPNPRLHLTDLRDSSRDTVSRVLDHSDLIVAALGYQSRGIDIRGEDGQQIALSGEKPGSAMVDSASQILDRDGLPVDGLFGLGMAAGYPLAGLHGEPSFAGQANGWALWRTDIGEALSQRLVDRLRTSAH